MRASRVAALVLGCLLFIPAIAILFTGGALGIGYAVGRGDDGYFDADLDRLVTDTAAITADDLTFTSEPGSPDWVLDVLDTDIRIRATSADENSDIFVGIGRLVDVDAYLTGVAHTEVVDLTGDLDAVYRDRSGDDVVEPPGEQDFWAATAAGAGTQQVEWEATSGRWAVVAMNADATPGVAVDVNVGATAGFILLLALIMLGLGLVLTALAVVLIVVGVRRQRTSTDSADTTTPPLAPTPTAASNRPHPVALTADLDPDLSRCKWLVKWFLAIPHFIVLAFLWLAFVILTLVAAVAIIATGRYPRGIFDFNVGVMRWSWRVSYYATTGGIGTDRYPPFSLRPEPDDPAHLDVTYPDTLSRGLVFVKWLLAIPHLVIVALLAGSSLGWIAADGDRVGFDFTGGLLGVLVVIAGIALLFTGRYPRALFDLIVGFNRWIFRTVAYVALMTDTYPPFRLDQGGHEPPATDPTPDPTPTDPWDPATTMPPPTPSSSYRPENIGTLDERPDVTV